MRWFLAFLTLSGLSCTFWGLLAICRWVVEKLLRIGLRKAPYQDVVISIDLSRQPLRVAHIRGVKRHAVRREEVAVMVPAHNEEVTIGRTLAALKRIIPARQIYVGSDASTDNTVEMVQETGCHVVDIHPNRGKAGVLVHLLEQYQLLDRYKAIMVVDADTEIDAHYLERALPFFDDPEVVAVAGHAVPHWHNHWPPRWSMFFTAYRVRLYRVLQAVMRYSQTWKYTNVTSIIPGFASMYRSSALRHIDISAPGLIIEDFNMTFEVQHKRLGKIAYHPSVFGVCHEPTTFRDYTRQVKRWNMGYWQTVKRHGVWPSFFCVSLLIFNMEMILFGLFMMLFPLFLLLFLATSFEPMTLSLPFLFPATLSFGDILVGVFLMDYLLTIIVAAIDRKPILLLYGLGFVVLRVLDGMLYLWSIPLALFVQSAGKWTSPKRQLA